MAVAEEEILGKWRTLPEIKKQEVADFIDFLAHKNKPVMPRLSLEGIWADLDISISKDEIDEARQEMWANFPREQFFNEEPK